ncbi:DeoR/GlpR family DNA-binding transcription regulator [Paramicrobacterium agarici]|uniref:DeoR family transcriptional regulator n=1 Tax=Paramicrobacterium agarici TaxID=630514 RepID=A0A2A9DZ22_9MICO|nr:DeoR/GlpR family DNA-binding transcription regulator [Microbacterium agarici]PFG31180.1 DeoR family transcriptional regulator [Microbacterium agarici]
MSKTTDRHERIREYMASRAFVNIHELAIAAGTSEVTVRRDLRALEQRGVVVREHGGARLADDLTEAQERFTSRELRNPHGKSEIGQRAVSLIDRGEHVAMNDGTTVMQVAMALESRREPATVTTNALNVALRLSESDSIDVYVLGGLVRRASYGTYQPDSSVIDRLHFDTAVLGVESMSKRGVTVDHPFDLAIAQAMIRQADRVVIVADESKWRRKGRMELATWDEIDVLVTDSAPTADLNQLLLDSGTETLTPETL